MSEAAKYTLDEEREMRRVIADGGEARCPRCDAAMTQRSIGGGSFGLGYARRREWYICPSCHRSMIVDLRRGTRN